MSEEFNKNIMFNNITFMLKERGKKIGELESEAGVSPGYISRTSKEGNTKPGIDFIMKAAEALNVSVDTLLRVDMSRLTPTERYLLTFLEKLAKDTLDDKLDWQTETDVYLNERLYPENMGGREHPLFELDTYCEVDKEGYPNALTRLVFFSRTYGRDTFIAGDCYNLRMKNGTILYIMNIRKRECSTREPKVPVIEIWMCPRRSKKQFLCSTTDTEEIAGLVEKLHAVVSEIAQRPKVNKDIKNVIEAFLNDDMEDNED